MKTTEKTKLTRSLDDLQRESAILARNAIALHPELPAGNLLDVMLEIAEPDFLAELDAMLRGRHLVTAVRTERAKDRRQQQESAWLSPQIRSAAMALPVRVPIGDGKTIPRDKLEYAHLDLYLEVLANQDKARWEQDAKRAAVEQIRKLWPRAKKRPRLMTLAEVDAVKAK